MVCSKCHRDQDQCSTGRKTPKGKPIMADKWGRQWIAHKCPNCIHGPVTQRRINNPGSRARLAPDTPKKVYDYSKGIPARPPRTKNRRKCTICASNLPPDRWFYHKECYPDYRDIFSEYGVCL